MTKPKNIAGKEVFFRYLTGTISAGLGVGLLYYLDRLGFPPIFRLSLFGFWIFAALGFLQAKKRVCVYYAQKNVCSLGKGKVPVTDPALFLALKKASIRIYVQAIIIAGTVMIVSVFI